MEYRVSTLLLMWAVTAFLGFCLENVWLIVRKGYFDNRNMSLPFLMGYGAAVLGMYFVFGTPDKPGVLITLTARFGHERMHYAAAVFFAVSIGEIVLGKTVERFCCIYYWDYTSIPLHITRYTSVPTSICFTVVIVTFMDKCFVPLAERLDTLPDRPAFYAGSIIFVLMTVDLVRSFYVMYKTKALNDRWRVQLTGKREMIRYDHIYES